MENNFSIFDLERRKWELAQERDASRKTEDDGASRTTGRDASSGVVDVEQVYNDLLAAADAAVEAVRRGEAPVPRPAVSALRSVLDGNLTDRLYEFISQQETSGGLGERFCFQALACMKIGSGLSFSIKKTHYLGLAALFCDLGRVRLPERLNFRSGRLSPQDRAKLRTLPQLSAQIARNMGSDFEWLATVAAQVEERIDGSGGPDGLSGKQISEFALIIGLVRHVMSRRIDEPRANPYLQSGVIREVIDNEKKRFPLRVLKEFLDQISLFPVNTLVRLNNESVGRVLATYKSQPMRPSLELLYDGLGKKKDRPKVIHLSNFPLLHIVGAIDPGDLDADQGGEAVEDVT